PAPSIDRSTKPPL
nr:Chain C, Lymphocyte Cytosolic Protein 2 [Mus musculus]1OEB_D Chain D, Lymphocyte Cytosolic Protein 2 [Mus musculus]